MTQIVPSGWEIVNTSYVDGNDANSANADYIDIRDDRTNFYFDLGAKKSKTFTIKLNASFLGAYYLPGSQVDINPGDYVLTAVDDAGNRIRQKVAVKLASEN